MKLNCKIIIKFQTSFFRLLQLIKETFYLTLIKLIRDILNFNSISQHSKLILLKNVYLLAEIQVYSET